MDPFVTATFDAGVARLSLNRAAKRNALNRQVLGELLDAITTARRDERVRVLVIGAEGPVFCAGMDLAEMQARASLPDAADEWQRDSRDYANILQLLYECSFPTIAAVQGPVLAGGVGLVVACDLVVASENASFALPEPARGIVAAMVTPLLLHRIGFGAATQMLLSGETFNAAAALRYGLCYDVVAAPQLNDRVNRLIEAIRQGAPVAIAQTKDFVERCRSTRLADQLEQAIRVSAAARETESAREGLQAFLEKRRPSWQP